MNAVTAIEPENAIPEHVDLHELSRMVGVPHRAIQRWTKQDGGIPFVGTGYKLMFPREAAVEWLKSNKPGLYVEMTQRGFR